MTILFSCVARGTTLLCSNQSGSGSFNDTIQAMLGNVPSSGDGKRTYTAHNNDYHVLIDNGILYVCVTESGVAKQQPFSFLNEIKRRLQSGPLARQAMTAASGELDRDFGFVLAQQMKNFSKAGGGGNDNVFKLQSQVNEVKDVMTQNIEKVMERGDRLEDLMDKTEELENSAHNFQRTSRKISRRYWWRNKKMTLIICGISLLVVVVIVIIILFSTHILPPKSSDDSDSPSTTKSP